VETEVLKKVFVEDTGLTGQLTAEDMAAFEAANIPFLLELCDQPPFDF